MKCLLVGGINILSIFFYYSKLGVVVFFLNQIQA